MEKKKVSISKTARYYQSGLISNKTKNLWFVFHGYGMLAEFFIKKFQYLVDKETVVIAPEATSRFYLDRNYERVGSSWITKVEKEDDIIELRKALDYNLGFKDIIEKKLSNSKFIENAPNNVIQGERNKLDDVLKKIEIIKQTISKKN